MRGKHAVTPVYCCIVTTCSNNVRGWIKFYKLSTNFDTFELSYINRKIILADHRFVIIMLNSVKGNLFKSCSSNVIVSFQFSA